MRVLHYVEYTYLKYYPLLSSGDANILQIENCMGFISVYIIGLLILTNHTRVISHFLAIMRDKHHTFTFSFTTARDTAVSSIPLIRQQTKWFLINFHNQKPKFRHMHKIEKHCHLFYPKCYLISIYIILRFSKFDI